MSFSPGDPWPQITVAGPGNIEVNLAHQTRAGRTTVYAFVDMDNAGSFQASADKALEARPDTIGFSIIAVAHSAPESEPMGRSELFTFAEPIAERVIGTREGLALVDRMGRLRQIDTLANLEGLLDKAEEIEAASQLAFAPVLVLEDVLESELCDRLLDYWSKEPKIENAVAANQGGNRSENTEFKRRADVVLKHKRLLEEVTTRINTRVLPEIYQVMRTQILDSEAFRIGCYESSDLGGFRRHRDNKTKHTSHRSFAMSMNLNSPTEYEGGQVVFPEYGDRLYQPGKGGCVVFSCHLLHEALPVTTGRRFGMFTFMVDDIGMKNLEKKRKST